MSVRCEGDVWVIKQIGEKQDFEGGIESDSYSATRTSDLCVRRPKASGASAAWVMHYAVQVSHAGVAAHAISIGAAPRNNGSRSLPPTLPRHCTVRGRSCAHRADAWHWCVPSTRA